MSGWDNRYDVDETEKHIQRVLNGEHKRRRGSGTAFDAIVVIAGIWIVVAVAAFVILRWL